MGQILYDYSELALAEIPPGHSTIAGSPTVGGADIATERALGITGTTGQSKVVAFGDALSGDVELLGRMYVTDVSGIVEGLANRIQSNTQYYAGDINERSSSHQLRVQKVNGTGAVLATATQTTTPNTWQWSRYRIEGTSHKLKVWQEGASEPGAWQIEVTDATFASGKPGFFNFRGGLYVSWVGIGTEGDSAPAFGDIAASPFISPPSNLSPTISVHSITGAQTFSWDAVTDADDYRLQIAKDGPLLTHTIFDQVIAGTSQLVDALTLPDDGSYLWRVCGRLGGLDGPWSATHAFATMAPPIVLTRQNGGVRVRTKSQNIVNGVLWSEPSELGHLVPGGKRFIWTYGTDHGVPGACGWGVGDELDLSDFVDNGAIAGIDGETLRLVYEPDDPDGLFFHMFWHKPISGGQATLRSRTAPSVNPFITNTHDGVVMPLTGGAEHTGYAYVERLGPGNYTARHLFGGSGANAEFKQSDSVDGETWTPYGPQIDVRSMLPSGRKLNLAGSSLFNHAGQLWMIAPEQPSNVSGSAAFADGYLAVIRMLNRHTPVGHAFRVLDYHDNPNEGDGDSRGAKTFTESNGAMSVLYDYSEDLFLATTTVEPPNTGPTVTITAPADGATITQGQTNSATATATDAEDGDLAASVEWSSDLDGALGTGASLDLSTLSVGAHTLTASVEDLSEPALSDTDEILLTVETALDIPDTPSIQSASIAGGILTLSSGAFSGPDGTSHVASQWQVQPAGGDWSSPVYDSGEDPSNLLSKAINVAAFSPGNYEARVRHKGDVV